MGRTKRSGAFECSEELVFLYVTLPLSSVALTSRLVATNSIYRLKARKFQLVAKMTQQRVPDPAAWSPETSGQHPPSSSSSLAEKQPSLRLNQSTSSHEALASPSKRQKSSSSSSLGEFARKDEVFDNTVENVRKKLKGNDLQSIMAVLIEVWNREIRGMAEGVPAGQPPLEPSSSEV
jgi:hypothetical protein